MKKFIKYCFIIFSLIVVSCDKGFDELNINKTAATTVNPAFVLNNAVINASFVNSILILEVGIVQQIVTPNSGVLTGANFNQDNRDATNQNWVRYFRSVIQSSMAKNQSVSALNVSSSDKLLVLKMTNFPIIYENLSINTPRICWIVDMVNRFDFNLFTVKPAQILDS